jgi:hypothetical protein
MVASIIVSAFASSAVRADYNSCVENPKVEWRSSKQFRMTKVGSKTVSVLLGDYFAYLDFDIRRLFRIGKPGRCFASVTAVFEFRILFRPRGKCRYASASASNSAMCFGRTFVRSVI